MKCVTKMSSVKWSLYMNYPFAKIDNEVKYSECLSKTLYFFDACDYILRFFIAYSTESITF